MARRRDRSAPRRCCAGPTRARQGAAGGVHPAGRGIRPDPRPRRMGAEDRRRTMPWRGARRDCYPTCRSTSPRGSSTARISAQRISEIVKTEKCDPSWIELEVTETSLLHDLDAIRKVLHQLRDEGFTVAIDDFGTGYSSLTHLKHFPIDTLKIDISFIADLETDPQRRRHHRGHHRTRAGPGAEGCRRGRGHARAARIPGCPRLRQLSGILDEQAAAGGRIR